MKRLFCFLLIVSLLLFNTSIISSAHSDSYIEINEFISDCDRFGECELSGISDTSVSYYYNFYKGNPNYYCYSLLDDCQKKMYNYFVNAEPGTLSFTFEFDYGEFPSENYTQDYLSTIMYAVIRDCPEIFYFDGYQVTGGYYYNGEEYIAILYCNMTLKSTSTYTQNNISNYYTVLQNSLKKVPVDLSNRLNFVKSVHDYLCENAYYPDLNSSDYVGNAHDAYGALVEGRTVCEGYSEAFKLICDYYKIPAVCITGTGVTNSGSGPHMWNAVQMDDGLWYLLDITWDDQGSYMFTDFFLVGLNSVDTHFGSSAFSESHISDGLYLPILPYATEKYTQTNHYTAFKATYNSFADNDANILVRSVFDANDSYIYYNGIYVETNGVATNAKFTIPSVENSQEEWTLVLLGDCNGDGLLNEADYSCAVNTVVSNSVISNAYDRACDVDCDGSLDAIDLAILQLSVNGLNDEFVIEK